MVRKIANRPAVKRGTEVTYKEINTLRKSNSNHVSVALPYSSTAYG